MKDNYNFFCDRVCSYIDYATGRELEQVHKELRDHMEDHAQTLMDIGRSPEEAEVAAILAMGDPEEIGREMNKQFPFVWLFLSRATAVIAIILALMLLSPLRDMYYRVSDSLEARKSPMEMFGHYSNPIDIRVELPGNDVAYFYCADIEKYGETDYRALIGLAVYDKSPFGQVYRDALDFCVEMETGFFQPSGGSFMGYGVHHKRMDIAIEYGQETVELYYTRLGNNIKVEIPLEWEGEE